MNKSIGDECMKDKIEQIWSEAQKDIEQIKSCADVVEIRNKYLSKKSELSTLSIALNQLPPEQKREFGQALGKVKGAISEKLEVLNKKLAEEELNKKLQSEQIDITLPGRFNTCGAKNPYYIVKDEIVDIFLRMGFEVAEGPEVETDRYNFELLNIPKDHPSRDMQDTFYLEDSLLMRTQTSAIQARFMEQKKGQPFKMICPGKTYRRDDDDATHSHQFSQVEGLVVDKGINMAHLKSTLELFVKKMFGEKRSIRLRSSFFPFTEPSVEIDISCAACGGKGCSMCKGTGYIEILGGGMVHPNVLRMNGYDPDVYSGFAFGLGTERVALLRYGIDDIRKLFNNDVRFLHQFKKRV